MNLLIFDLGETIGAAFTGVLLTLDGIVYGTIAKMYKIYTLLAAQKLLSSDAFQTIANKLYIIIGVAMLFVLAYSILRAIIDPDQLGKGDMSGKKVITGVVTCILGLALTPVIFNLIYQGQDIILQSNIIAKMFFASDSRTTSHDDIVVNGEVALPAGEVQDDSALFDSAGNVVATYIWQAFFHPSELYDISEDDIVGKNADYFVHPAITTISLAGCAIGVGAAILASVFTFGFGALAVAGTVAACSAGVIGGVTNAVDIALADEITLAQAFSYATSTGDFGIFIVFADNYIKGEIQYYWFFSTLVGAFVVYAFLSFSIDMAVRAAKLAYYQIIAPIPLILQIVPKFRPNFDKWVKNIISTFLEVFVRLSVVYVVVYIITHLNTISSTNNILFNNQELSMDIGFFVRVILILGLVIFAKQAPKLISDTFGIPAGDMKLGLGQKLAEGGLYTAAATGLAAAGSFAQNFGVGVQRARGEMKRADTLTGKAQAFGRGFIRSTASGVAGGLSAGARVGYRGARDFRKNPMKLRDVKDATANGVRAANDARVHRKAYNEQHANDEAFNGLIKGSMAGHINDARSTVSSFLTGGSVDTSFYDNKINALSQLAGLNSKLESTVQTNKDLIKAQRHLDEKNRQDLKEFAFDQMKQKEHNTFDPAFAAKYKAVREKILLRTPSMSDAQYDADFATAIAALETQYNTNPSAMTAAEKKAYEDFRREFGNSLKKDDDEYKDKLQNAFDLDFTAKHGKLSDFSLSPNSPEYAAALASKDAAVEAATTAVKKAKANAIQAELLKSIATGDQATARVLKEFIRDHQAEFRATNGTEINGKRLENYLEGYFGANVLNGQVDLEQMFNGKVYDGTLSNGNVLTMDFTGSVPTYTIKDSSGAVIADKVSKEKFNDYLTRTGSEIASMDASNVSGVFKQIKKDAESATSAILDSSEYIDAQSRKRKQESKK